MGTGLNKLQGVLAGNRKVTVFVFAIIAIALMHMVGDLGASEAASSLWKIVAAFMAGNLGEHIGDGIGRKTETPPEG